MMITISGKQVKKLILILAILTQVNIYSLHKTKMNEAPYVVNNSVNYNVELPMASKGVELHSFAHFVAHVSARKFFEFFLEISLP